MTLGRGARKELPSFSTQKEKKMSLSNYPPGAENDPFAPYNQVDEDDEYAEAEAKIEALDGQELYESAGADINADLDVFDLKLFRRYDDSRKWSELSEHEQKLWDTYAEVRQGFAYLLLEDS